MVTPTPPGNIFRADYRIEKGSKYQGDCSHATSKPLKLLQWNIERGYKLPGIIEELREIDADVISLQEVDVLCERSGGVDTGVEIARALGLNYVFFSEFEELHSPLRDARSQGGGVHGNAILTKLDIIDVEIIPHSVHPVDWNNPAHPRCQREPRRGQRAVLRATVAVPLEAGTTPLAVYCAHFEVFCGMLARIAQLSDVFEDVRKLIRKGTHFHFALLGDLNTMAHGIARLSPTYCCDRMRFLSFGNDEAVMWERYVLSINDVAFHPSADGDRGQVSVAEKQERERTINKQLQRWGCTPQVAMAATNPGFACPFPAATTITLDNPNYKLWGFSFMRGKLDWTLLRRFAVTSTRFGNLDYRLSDHRWLLVEGHLH